MDFHYWAIFVTTVIGVSIIPGPSTLIAFSHGASFGWLRSLHTALGNGVASITQAIAASAGLGIVITSSATLFMAIKYAGAIYLIYVGIQMWRSAAHRVSLGSNKVAKQNKAGKLFISGFTVAVSNPKAIAFFTALFPQFLASDGNSLTQLATMVILVGISAFSVAFLYGIIGAWVHGMELSKKVMTRVYKTTGGLFVASGLGLALSENNR